MAISDVPGTTDMVRLPQNILAAMGVGRPGMRATKKELTNALIDAGYGPTKAKKWINTLIDTGAIILVGEDPIYGLELYSCKWWGSVALITRERPQKVRVDLTDEELKVFHAKGMVAE